MSDDDCRHQGNSEHKSKEPTKSEIQSDDSDSSSMIKQVQQMVIVDNINKIKCMEKRLSKSRRHRTKPKPNRHRKKSKSKSILNKRQVDKHLTQLGHENLEPLQTSPSSTQTSLINEKMTKNKKPQLHSRRVLNRLRNSYFNKFRHQVTTTTARSPFKSAFNKKSMLCVVNSPIDLFSYHPDIDHPINDSSPQLTSTELNDESLSDYNSDNSIVPYESLVSEIEQIHEELFNQEYKCLDFVRKSCQLINTKSKTNSKRIKQTSTKPQ